MSTKFWQEHSLIKLERLLLLATVSTTRALVRVWLIFPGSHTSLRQCLTSFFSWFPQMVHGVCRFFFPFLVPVQAHSPCQYVWEGGTLGRLRGTVAICKTCLPLSPWQQWQSVRTDMSRAHLSIVLIVVKSYWVHLPSGVGTVVILVIVLLLRDLLELITKWTWDPYCA